MRLIVIIFLFFSFVGIGQINFQLGQSVTCGNNKGIYEINSYDNSTNYKVDYRKPGFETFFKISCYTPWDTTKFSIKYTLELGLKRYNYYSETSKIHYSDDTTQEVRAAMLLAHGFYFTNGADFIYRFSRRVHLINSIGIKVSAVNKIDQERLWELGDAIWYNPALIENSLTNPLITLNFSPQLLFHFNKVSLGFHLSQDVFMINNLINNFKSANDNFAKAHISSFTSMGISIMPNFYLVPNPKAEEEF